MSSNKKTFASPVSPAGTKKTNIEASIAAIPLSGVASQPLTASSQPIVASPGTPTGSGTGAPRPAVTPIQPTTPAGAGGSSGARSPEIQRALSGQHDYSWYTDNFHLAKANNVIAADNAERRERQRSASLVASPEPPKNEKEENKVKAVTPVLNLENKKPVSLGEGEKADDSKGSGRGR